MSTTITRASDSATSAPDLIVGWSDAYDSDTEVTGLIGGSVAVSVLGARPRSGTMKLLYSTGSAANTARTFFSASAANAGFALASTDLAMVNISSYVILRTQWTLDPETRVAWTVDIDWQAL